MSVLTSSSPIVPLERMERIKSHKKRNFGRPLSAAFTSTHSHSHTSLQPPAVSNAKRIQKLTTLCTSTIESFGIETISLVPDCLLKDCSSVILVHFDDKRKVSAYAFQQIPAELNGWSMPVPLKLSLNTKEFNFTKGINSIFLIRKHGMFNKLINGEIRLGQDCTVVSLNKQDREPHIYDENGIKTIDMVDFPVDVTLLSSSPIPSAFSVRNIDIAVDHKKMIKLYGSSTVDPIDILSGHVEIRRLSVHNALKNFGFSHFNCLEFSKGVNDKVMLELIELRKEVVDVSKISEFVKKRLKEKLLTARENLALGVANTPSQLFHKSAYWESSEVKKNQKRMNSRLVPLGLAEYFIEADGNCQFRALSYQLFGTEKYYKEMRERACDHIVAFKETYSVYFESEKIFWIYVKKMRKDSWGDEVTLSAISNCFGVEIHCITSNEKNWHLHYVPSCHQMLTRKKKAFISYIYPVHYNALILEKNKR